MERLLPRSQGIIPIMENHGSGERKISHDDNLRRIMMIKNTLGTLDEQESLVKPNYKPALITLAVLYFMMGFITVLNDTLVPFFKAGFTLNYSQSSLVQFYFFLTYGLMSIPSSRMVGKLGYKNGMVLGFSIAA